VTDWILIACLKRLFAEFDDIAPHRDHASDGAIGDTAHQHEVSDHNPDETGSVPIHDADKINEVHAIDVDSDLREPGLSMEAVVQFLLARCRAGKETRLRYMIYNRRIWEASNDWRERPYTGSSAHTEHAHFSASYDSGKEASTASWHLEEINMPSLDEIANAVWNHTEPDPEPDVSGATERRVGGDMRMIEKRRRDMEKRLDDKIDALSDKLDQVLSKLGGGGSATL
jgi:hypothetical protein